MWHNTELNKYETTEFSRRVAVSAHGLQNVADVYTRHVISNEYRVTIFYIYDYTKSRLKPTPRVQQIALQLDRDMSADVFVKNNPLFSEYCASGCDVDTTYGIRFEPFSIPEALQARLAFSTRNDAIAMHLSLSIPEGRESPAKGDWRLSRVVGGLAYSH